ncbi:MAG: hypothetical protein JWO86_6049 [Myxococcaceae bacterium]|nr:hypothetical protein [Myxococcaceae bacterium]
MKQPPPEPLAQSPAVPTTRSTTVINHVAPTVVRRRVVEVPVSVRTNAYAAPDEDDESGPPSSVNVARALASLRGHELERLEEIMDADEDEEAAAEQAAASNARVSQERSPPSLPRPPTVKVGPTISLALLAERLGVDDQELVTALVTHGFFSVTVKATLPRETARAAATLFGYQIEETDEVEAPSSKAKSKRAKAAAGTKAKTTTTTATSKGGNSVTRRTSRRA